MREAGHKPCLVEVDGRRHSIREALICELPDWTLPLAVMTCDDFLAHELSTAAIRCGIGPDPSRLAVLGVNNSPQAELNTPPLSSVRLDGRRTGHAAAQMLDQLMAGKSFKSPPITRIPPLGVEERASTAQPGFDDPPISRILERMRRHAGRAMNIDDLLIDIPLSRRTFERRFRKATGRTPWEEIRRVQVEHVKRLLEQTDWSTKRIALSSAFKTPSRLAAVFREETGETPQGWRRRYRM
ncbi:MAG: substrate-binding domain-containing protein [Oceanipulchritudo sp.]